MKTKIVKSKKVEKKVIKGKAKAEKGKAKEEKVLDFTDKALTREGNKSKRILLLKAVGSLVKKVGKAEKVFEIKALIGRDYVASSLLPKISRYYGNGLRVTNKEAKAFSKGNGKNTIGVTKIGLLKI